MSVERKLPRLLLVEPDFLLRHTVARVARELRLADVQESTSVLHAAETLTAADFDAVLIALDAQGEALKLLQRLSEGHSVRQSAMQVAVTADDCDAGLALRLRELNVRRVLLKPFKVKGVIETLAGLCTAPRRTV